MAILTRIASDGMPIEMTNTTMDKAQLKLSVIAPTHKRCIERAGKTVTVEPFWEVSYNENGYVSSIKKVVTGSPAPLKVIPFVNEAVGDEKVEGMGTYYKDCTASTDDGVIYAVYDGATNYVCNVNIVTKEIIPNVGNSNDKALVARMTSYGEAFLKAFAG